MSSCPSHVEPGVTAVVPTERGLIEVWLSARELQVLHGVAGGLGNPGIAATLGVSRATIKTHLYRIGKKLRTGDRAHMVLLAMRAGLIS